MRLDVALPARALARSRAHAKELIGNGGVSVNGVVCTRASTPVDDDDVIEVLDPAARYVSRAALKLVGALEACEPLGLDVRGRRALDIGASTGGFTQVLIERGATHVTALDVGHDQLAAEVRGDPRVTVVEGFNARELDASDHASGADLVVADVSFISLTYIVPPLERALDGPADVLLMVKPQFEVGRERLGSGGVVTSGLDRAAAVRSVADAMSVAGWTLHHVERSAVPGPQGNVEFFVWASRVWQASGDARPVLDGAQLHHAIEGEVARE